MTTDRARDILNAASLGRGTGHVYTDDEAAALLALARSLARPLAQSLRRSAPHDEPNRTPLRLVVIGRAA